MQTYNKKKIIIQMTFLKYKLIFYGQNNQIDIRSFIRKIKSK